MKAIGYQHCLPVEDPQSLIDFELPMPVAVGRDLLVRVMAVSVASTPRCAVRPHRPQARPGCWASTQPASSRRWGPA